MKKMIGISVALVTGVAVVLNREKLYDLYCWTFHKHFWGGGNYETCIDCHPHRKLATPLSNLNKLESDVHIPYWIKES